MFRHIPVLAEQIAGFAPLNTRTILDCTVGGGGHSRRLLERFPDAQLRGIDRDPAAIEATEEELHEFSTRVRLRRCRFSELGGFLPLWGTKFDYVIADIGMSSEQLTRGERGFSFLEEGPLDMRMDGDFQPLTAREVLHRSSEKELRELLKKYGEEPFAAKIARAVVEARHGKNLETTLQLSELVSRTIPRRFHKNGFHPATLTFQALRIAVNQELRELKLLLELLPEHLNPGARLSVISFHSLEDRKVKHCFRNWENPCTCPPKLPYCVCGLKPLGKVLTRRPVKAGEEEKSHNPRSRSARLRVFEFEKEAVD